MPITIGRRPDHTVDEPLGLMSDWHRRVEHCLDSLTALAAQAGETPLSGAQRADLEGALTYCATAAPRHTADEEQSLFPRLRACADPEAARALETVARLEHDHDEGEVHHGAVDVRGRRWLNEGVLDGGARPLLRAHLAALALIYGDHIAIEDGDLFPAAARLLTRADLRDIGREMAARRQVTRSDPRSGRARQTIGPRRW